MIQKVERRQQMPPLTVLVKLNTIVAEVTAYARLYRERV
jgi:hypothetical protein